MMKTPNLRLISRLLKFALITAGLIGPAAALQSAPKSLGKEPKENPRLIFNEKEKPAKDPALAKYGMYAKTAARPASVDAVDTALPLQLKAGERIALVGNTLLDRARNFAYFETLVQQSFPDKKLIVRNLAWAGDSLESQPRPLNLADLEQHLTYEKIDVIIAAFGFNESFAGKEGLETFRIRLVEYLKKLKTSAFNGKTGPRIVLLSPIANEDIKRVAAAAMNNEQLAAYTKVMKEVALEQKVGFVNVFDATQTAMESPGDDLTVNGIHLTREGYQLFGNTVYEQIFGKKAPSVNESLRQEVLEKNKQFFRRYRPLNTYYYTGKRSEEHGYNDFLPAMRNFDLMVANRYKRIWEVAQGKPVAETIDDSNLPPLEEVWEARGINPLLSAEDEKKAFKIDPRFDVSLFAGEEQFPDIANPINMRWDSKGRLWVCCSTSYPQIFPGEEPHDKLVILEDTDGDGRADKSSIFADDLYQPLSFEFGNGGVYVSAQPDLIFIKDTDGDGKADHRQVVLMGLGTEDSHHALHDFAWTPDGDLVFRESIFHHSQVETPYGPVRQRNSGWFRYDPKTERLTAFGTYSSTNPWGVTFDDWGQHVASHPIYAAAFHALNPVYPEQHPTPKGLPAYSGTCGHDFVDFKTFPKEMQGGFVKARYKPTNRIEYHHWKESEFGYREEYVGDILFSSDLSFIPVDLRFGPRGALYVCDWYNTIKSHNQYSMRDSRRDKKSGRIWRISAKGSEPVDPPKIAGASITELLDNLKLPQYRYRYWSRRELREQGAGKVESALGQWLLGLDRADPRYRHHQVEALWMYRGVGRVNADLLADLLSCDNYHARAAATQQLRYWGADMKNSIVLLKQAANDPKPAVRMEAAIAASYIGSEQALLAMLDTLKYPYGGHLAYAIRTSLGSKNLKKYWGASEGYKKDHPEIAAFYAKFEIAQKGKGRKKNSKQEELFDAQKDVKKVTISIVKERLMYSLKKFEVKPGQPVRIDFVNPDATPHNLVVVKPGALEEVGMAANEMAKDPEASKLGFIPKSDKILHHTRMLNAYEAEYLRFNAPKQPGVYPYICTFPGHWIIMRGEMIVK
ncbi:MAG: GDSL-type esterase/lipase family protein [Verrucomicrobiales bacterium]|nr:GDSL-type esterase/lipase family protein [Verrucomicrobiales bacterium]